MMTTLTVYIEKQLEKIKFENEHTRDYLVNLFSTEHTASTILSFDRHTSVVIEWAKIANSSDFASVQKFADSLCFKNVFFLNKSDDSELLHAIGASAYQKCNAILMGSWPIYREMHNRYSFICSDIRCAFQRK